MDSRSKAEQLGDTWLELRQNGRIRLSKAFPLFGTTYVTLCKWAREGKVRTIPVGNSKFVTIDEVERFRREGNYTGNANPMDSYS